MRTHRHCEEARSADEALRTSVILSGAALRTGSAKDLEILRPLWGLRMTESVRLLRPYLDLRLAMTAFMVLFLISGCSLPSNTSADALLGKIPIQSGGRVKPFGSFAREALLSVTGKTSFEGRSATRVVWDWMTDPEAWHTKSFLPVRYGPLQKEFGLMVIGGKISPELVLTHGPFQAKVTEALHKEEAKRPLLPLEKKRIELYDQARLFQAIAQGSLPGFIPHAQDPRAGWAPLAALTDAEQTKVLEQVYNPLLLNRLGKSLHLLVESLREKDSTRMAEQVQEFSMNFEQLIESQDIVLDRARLLAELGYYQIQPFRWAWVLYLASVLLGSAGAALPRHSEPPACRQAGEGGEESRAQGPGDGVMAKSARYLWVFLLLAAFGIHTLGFILRSYIAGRPPVSNMYESVIWVAWAAVLFAVILGLIYHRPLLAKAAAWVACFTLLIGESFPVALDPSLSPLVPVLRSNYWLTLHVLTITLSYGAFALAWGLAHINLWNFAFHPNREEEAEKLNEYLYRALQMGVVLLAAGTILGGVWANASWGRFWGWDPKETWALIALLGYLAVLHGRSAGWLGPFGTALGSAAAFLGIIMAWYGVNFVLAAGLHSYGFSGGGFPCVAAIAAADLVFISFLAFRYNKNLRTCSFTKTT